MEAQFTERTKLPYFSCGYLCIMADFLYHPLTVSLGEWLLVWNFYSSSGSLEEALSQAPIGSPCLCNGQGTLQQVRSYLRTTIPFPRELAGQCLLASWSCCLELLIPLQPFLLPGHNHSRSQLFLSCCTVETHSCQALR